MFFYEKLSQYVCVYSIIERNNMAPRGKLKTRENVVKVKYNTTMSTEHKTDKLQYSCHRSVISRSFLCVFISFPASGLLYPHISASNILFHAFYLSRILSAMITQFVGCNNTSSQGLGRKRGWHDLTQNYWDNITVVQSDLFCNNCQEYKILW